MNVLDKIVAHKRLEVAECKKRTSVQMLEKAPFFTWKGPSPSQWLRDPSKSGIIAEHKRKSPSKGIINDRLSVEEIVKGYEQAGASVISVLTDQEFFGGSDEDLRKAREAVSCPLLRKEFIVDEYQILEAKALGANLILLIAACLSPDEIKKFSELTCTLGMEVLLEVHDADELRSNLFDTIHLIGVNNRNLKDFSVSLETSIRLAPEIPDKYIKISESGIDDVNAIKTLKTHGFQGFLIGESFMKTMNPGGRMEEFVKALKS